MDQFDSGRSQDGQPPTWQADSCSSLLDRAETPSDRVQAVAVHVELQVDDSLTQGQFLVASGFQEAPGGAAVGSIYLVDGRRVQIGEDALVIGRMPECDVPLSDSNVSRRHAEVRRQGTGFVVVDLGSTNGTRVNGAQVKERLLNNGDEITVGATKLRFEAS